MKKFLLFIFVGAVLLSACAARAIVPTESPGATTPSAPERALPTNASASVVPMGFGGTRYDTTLGKPVTLHVRDSARVADTSDEFTIYLWSVPQDSRCPKTVQCFTAGDVSADIVFQENGLMHPPIFTLTYPTKPSQVIQDYIVTVTDVQPARETPDVIPQEKYAVTFVITRNVPTPNATAVSAPTTVSQIPTATTEKLDESFVLNMYRTANVSDANMKITFNAVLEDSRCPRNVLCVQAGRVLIALTVARGERIAFFTLSDVPPDARTRVYFQDYEIVLQEVTPYRQSLTEKIPPKDYAAKLIVHQTLPPTVVHKNEPIVLKPGNSATLADEDITLNFVRVVSDSRCPYGAMCAVRGNAPVEITLRVGGETKSYVLDTDAELTKTRNQNFGNVTVELLSLNPYPRVDLQAPDIAPDEYEATFVVHKFASSK